MRIYTCELFTKNITFVRYLDCGCIIIISQVNVELMFVKMQSIIKEISVLVMHATVCFLVITKRMLNVVVRFTVYWPCPNK